MAIETQPQGETAGSALPADRLRMLQGWAMVRRAPGYVWRPATVAAIPEVFDLARQAHTTIAPRGAGYSYNDAALNSEAIVLDLTALRGITACDPATGVITVEPGVTIRDLWRTVLPDGWWPPVVPGTMGPTIGGCLAMNVHGKNAWRAGPIGEHVLACDLLTPDGTTRTITPLGDPGLFHAAIGGMGLLGVFTSITLQMRRVRNGRVQTHHFAARDLSEMFAIFARETTPGARPAADYLVGWVDGFASGASLGRGLVERADFIEEADPASLRLAAQDVAPRIAGIVPRSELWRVMKPMFNDPIMRLANGAQYRRGSAAHAAPVPHAQFHFFHDYMPNWQRAWLPGGLRQFQVFVPRAAAASTFATLLRFAQTADIPPYLVVFKQHRANQSLLAYELDGFSLSLDFHVTARNTTRLDTLLHALRGPVMDAGGRFYMAKDDVIDAADFARSLGAERVAAFRAIKQQLDPEGNLMSNLGRRILAMDALPA